MVYDYLLQCALRHGWWELKPRNRLTCSRFWNANTSTVCGFVITMLLICSQRHYHLQWIQINQLIESILVNTQIICEIYIHISTYIAKYEDFIAFTIKFSFLQFIFISLKVWPWYGVVQQHLRRLLAPGFEWVVDFWLSCFSCSPSWYEFHSMNPIILISAGFVKLIPFQLRVLAIRLHERALFYCDVCS